MTPKNAANNSRVDNGSGCFAPESTPAVSTGMCSHIATSFTNNGELHADTSQLNIRASRVIGEKMATY